MSTETGFAFAADPELVRPDDTLDLACQLLFATGRPVTLDELAAQLGQRPAAVVEAVERFEAVGRVRRNAEGQIIASYGISVVPGDYELRIGERLRWVACAKTGLGVLGALAGGGTLATRCPQTGEPVRVEFDGGTPRPSGSAVLWPSEVFQSSCQSAAGQLCATFSLFRDARAAHEWAAARGVDAEVLDPREATSRTVARYRHSLGVPQNRETLLGGVSQ